MKETVPSFGIPIFEDQNYDNRTLPLDPAPIPATLAGHRVIAFAFIPTRTGEKPNLAVAVVYEEGKPVERAYITYYVGAAQGGEWEPWGGTYDCSYVNAMEIFMEDLKHRI